MSGCAPSCLIAVSSHGFGHLSQVTPVINTADKIIHDRDLDPVQWTVRTTIEASQVRSRIVPKVRIDLDSDDFGMVMLDAFSVDLPASLARYAQQHKDWERHVDRVAQHLSQLGIDTVLADVPYLTLAAAAKAGIRSLAICSLNWADILLACVSNDAGALRQADMSVRAFDQILEHMRDAYNSAHVFLQPAPSMAMTTLHKTLHIGPVCEPPEGPGREALQELVERQGHKQPGWFVLVSMGGIPTQLNLKTWPTHCLGKPVYYLVAPNLVGEHAHAVSTQAPGLSFANLFASCDLFIGKPGYGTFVEAACSGTPLIYLERSGWAEAKALTGWIEVHGRARAMTLSQLESKRLAQCMSELLLAGRFSPIQPSGNIQAANPLLQVLFGSKQSAPYQSVN